MTTNEIKPLPKSLHTVTAIVRVARYMMNGPSMPTASEAIAKALDVLGYAGAPDPHELAAKALKAMEA